MPRSIRRALLIILGLTLAAAALTVRTPARQAAWLADFDRLEQYLASAGANFDWVVAKRGLDLVALDTLTRREIASSYTSIGAAWTARAFVKNFADGHTRARIRPAIWWRGLTGSDSTTDGSGMTRTEGTAPTLLSTMSANAACAAAGLDADARPDGWELPFPEVAGAELLADEEFPSVLITLPDGRKIGVLRIANFGHARFGATCVRAWEAFGPQLTEPCTGECRWSFVAAVMRQGAMRAAGVANELRRQGAAVVVVDITGNGGGSEYADALARALAARPLHLAPGGIIRHRLHAEILAEERAALAADSARATPAQRVLLDRAIAQADSLLGEMARDCQRQVVWTGGTPACSNTVVVPRLASYLPSEALEGLTSGWVLWGPSWVGVQEGIYSGPLLVLQDHRSASASEEFAARLRDNDAALLVGERSFGAGCGYINGGTRLELEALGLLVRAPDCQRLRRDGSNETEGLPADVEAGWTAEDTPALRVEKALTALARAF
jgi:hypothetical protein